MIIISIISLPKNNIQLIKFQGKTIVQLKELIKFQFKTIVLLKIVNKSIIMLLNKKELLHREIVNHKSYFEAPFSSLHLIHLNQYQKKGYRLKYSI